MPSAASGAVAAKNQPEYPSAKSRGKSVDPYADGMSHRTASANKMWSMQSPHLSKIHVDPATSESASKC